MITYALPISLNDDLTSRVTLNILRGRSCSEAVAAPWSTWSGRPYTEAIVVMWTKGKYVVWTMG